MKSQKITSEIADDRRSYQDACGAAHALDLIGERWALLVMRELFFGPKRFGDLRADLPGISANVLTRRLEGLEAAGIVLRRKLAPPASVQVYGLTPWGYESEPIFQALGRWAARSPDHDPSLPLSVVSLMLSFRTMLDPIRARGVEMHVGFRIGAETFVSHVAAGRIEIVRVGIQDVAATIRGTPPRHCRSRLWRSASRQVDCDRLDCDRREAGGRRAVHHALHLAAKVEIRPATPGRNPLTAGGRAIPV